MSSRKVAKKKTGMQVVVAIVVLVTLTTVLFLRAQAERPEPVTICAILPFSGIGAYLVEVKDAMLFAVEHINRWGGINGRLVEIVFADSKSDPYVAEQEMIAMEELYHPLMFVSALSNVSMHLRDIAEELHVVLFGLVVSAQDFTEGKEWTYRLYSNAQGEVDSFLTTLRYLRSNDIGLLHADDAFSMSVASMLAEQYREGTIESIEISSTSTNFTQPIADLIDNEVIVVAALRSQLVEILIQLNHSGYSGHVLATSGASSPTSRAFPELEGVYVSSPLFYNPTNTLAADLRESYLETFGVELTHQGASGYDLVMLISGLLEDEEISREHLKELLDQGFVYSASMGVLDILPGSHEMVFPLYAARIEGGELVFL